MARTQDTAVSSYRSRTSFARSERLVGAFVLGVIIIVCALILGSESLRKLREDPMILFARVESAQGVSVDTPVTISGIEVGTVSSIEFTERNDIVLQLRIGEKYRNRLRADAHAAITTLGLFGKTQLDISPGTPAAASLADGAELAVEQAAPVSEAFADIAPLITRLETTVAQIAGIVAAIDPAKVQTIVEHTAEISGAVDAAQVSKLLIDATQVSASLSRQMDRLEAGQGALGAVLADEGFERDVRGAVEALGSTWSQTRDRVAEFEPVIGDIVTISASTRVASEQLPQLVSGVETAVGQINLTLSTLNTELQQLPDLALRLKLLLEETKRTIEGMQRVWPLSKAIEGPPLEPVIKVLPLND